MFCRKSIETVVAQTTCKPHVRRPTCWMCVAVSGKLTKCFKLQNNQYLHSTLGSAVRRQHTWLRSLIFEGRKTFASLFGGGPCVGCVSRQSVSNCKTTNICTAHLAPPCDESTLGSAALSLRATKHLQASAAAAHVLDVGRRFRRIDKVSQTV